MKKIMIVCSWMMVTAAFAANIGVVNMERLIAEHPRTVRDLQTLEQYIEDFEEERDEHLAALRTMSESFETLRAEAEDIGLAPEEARTRRQRAAAKLEQLRQAEIALRELAAERQQELSRMERRMRDRVVADLRRTLREVAEEKGLDMILDGGEDPAGGYGAVVFSTDAHEITGDVLQRIRGTEPTP